MILEDLPTDEHLRLFASADVCVAPSRWEGLGLHLYEAMALGLPVITNDNPPMNEVIVDGDNGLLVRGSPARAGEVGHPRLSCRRPRARRARSQATRDPDVARGACERALAPPASDCAGSGRSTTTQRCSTSLD